MAPLTLDQKLRRIWNWIRGKRITHSDHKRGRVLIRTGHNSANRSNGGQWYLLRYDATNGPPPLPRFSRGRLDNPVTHFEVTRFTGEELTRARRWYELHHGVLQEGQELLLVCIYEPNDKTSPKLLTMAYRPNEIFEVEHPWLSSQYSGPSFATYFATWYGSGILKESDVMDFEIFCHLRPGIKPLPWWGATWR